MPSDSKKRKDAKKKEAAKTRQKKTPQQGTNDEDGEASSSTQDHQVNGEMVKQNGIQKEGWSSLFLVYILCSIYKRIRNLPRMYN